MCKVGQMRMLKSGMGLQYLLEEGYRILGNPLVIFDADYSLIAQTDGPDDDRLWTELTTTGTFSKKTQVFFMEECFTDAVANAEKLALMKSDHLNYDRILGHLFNGKGVKVANLLMLDCHNPFTPETVSAFEVLAELLTEELRDDASYIAYGHAYQERWIKKLIDYDIEERGLYSPHVQILYNGFQDHLYLALADISRYRAQEDEVRALMECFRQAREDFKYSIYKDYIVILMSTEDVQFDARWELRGLAECLEREGILVGVSRRFDNIFTLRQYYFEALHALRDRKPGDRRHIFVYRECGE